jgi:A/G-specific adenine glycosylase
MALVSFTSTLLHWYDEHRRIMPWRGEKDPYKIWISEIILQQTRVAQGWDYYTRFIERFPTIQRLADASLDEVLLVWQGLGYYSRARHLHEAALYIMQHYGGVFPASYVDIRSLKGVGDYTAAAIASMGFGLPYPAVDGNVCRVICRVFGIADDIQQNSTRKIITQHCTKLMQGFEPGEFNQALMDFGSLQCTPKNPNCENCPLATRCHACQYQMTNHLPVKSNHIKIKTREFHYLCQVNNGQTIIRQRVDNDIWKGLYEFPMIECEYHRVREKTRDILPSEFPDKTIWQTKHQLTHQTILAFFYLVKTDKMPDLQPHEILVDLSKLTSYPFPKIMTDFIETVLKNVKSQSKAKAK